MAPTEPRRVVLVLGAGASVDYGYPSAARLRDDITGRAQCLQDHQRNQKMQEHLRVIGWEQDNIDEFTAAFLRSGQPSVDAFLERRQNFMTIGKQAIAAVLMAYENERELHRVADPKRWYDFLWERIDGGAEGFLRPPAGIVTFNYDRSLEQYLGMALQDSYEQLSDGDVQKRLQSLNIIHVHGTLGQPPFLHLGARRYGGKFTAMDVVDTAKKIKIVDKDTDVEADDDFSRARAELDEANTVCFLGFGYHDANIQRLDLPQILPKTDRVFGTVYDLLTNEMKSAETRLGMNGSLPRVNDDEASQYDCLKYLRRFDVL